MIAILTPYTRSERTTAAIQLADLIVAHGLDVNLIAVDKQSGHAVNPFWDRLVQSGRGNGLYSGCKDAKTVIHFCTDADLYRKASLVAKNCKHIAVPEWQSLAPHEAGILAEMTHVVCPATAQKDALRMTVFKKKLDTKKLRTCLWDAGLPVTRREGLVSDNRLRLLIHCDKSATYWCSQLVVELVDQLLGIYHYTEITVSSVKAWSKRVRADFNKLKEKWPERFSYVPALNLPQLFHEHDWTLLPGVRSEFGLDACQSLACGAPVLAHSIPPYDDVIFEGANGFQVPCAIKLGTMLSPIAVADIGSWLDATEKAFTDPRTLFKLQNTNTQIVKRREVFSAFWQKLLTADEG